jgi:hypothetical protein
MGWVSEIRDPEKSHPGSGSWGQKSTGFRNRNSGIYMYFLICRYGIVNEWKINVAIKKRYSFLRNFYKH